MIKENNMYPSKPRTFIYYLDSTRGKPCINKEEATYAFHEIQARKPLGKPVNILQVDEYNSRADPNQKIWRIKYLEVND